ERGGGWAGVGGGRTRGGGAEVLRHRDLPAPGVLAVPDRLQERVGEAEEDYVLPRLLPEVVVDAEDGALVKGGQKDAVQFPGRREVVAEGLFDDDPGARRAARRGELFHDHFEQRGRNGEVVRRPLGRPEFLAEGLKRCRALVI